MFDFHDVVFCVIQLETSPERSQKRIEQVTCAPPTDPEERLQHSDEYEVMKIVSPRGSDVIICSERPDSPYLVLKGPSPPALGGTVNLILSFSNSGDTQLQVQTPGGEEGVTEPEPVHRVRITTQIDHLNKILTKTGTFLSGFQISI